MANSFQWILPPSRAWSIPALLDFIKGKCTLVLVSWSPVIEAQMKENAPWTDRTSNARQTLETEVYEKSDTTVALIARGMMDYEVFLELKKKGQSILSPELTQAGKYAVILPTLEAHYTDIFEELVKVLAS